MINRLQLQQLFEESWGTKEKISDLLSYTQNRKLICELVRFNDLDIEAKLYIAESLLLFASPSLGNLSLDYDLFWFIRNVAKDMIPYGNFTGRRFPPLKRALELIGECTAEDHYTATIIAPYLFSELEYQFRVKSRYLDWQGKIIRELPKLSKKDKPTGKGGKVNKLKLTIKYFLYRNKSDLATHIKTIDFKLPKYYIPSDTGRSMKFKNGMRGTFDPEKVNIAKRLGYARNGILHGEFPFIGSEAFFCALLIIIIYYHERLVKI